MTGFLIANIEHGLTGDAKGSRFSGALRVRGGVIAGMGALAPEPGEQVIDARGCAVTPGLVNTHHHLFQSVLKAVPEGLNEALDVWLQKVPYAYWPFIDDKILKTSARIGLAELVLSGATTVCDHHYVFSSRYDYDPAAVLFETAAEFGVRFVLARGGNAKARASFDDPSLPDPFRETLDAFLDGVGAAARRWHDPAPDAMRRVVMAPTTPTFNFEAEDLPVLAETARALGIRLHSHLSENEGYVTYTLRTHGERPVPWLARQGWTGPDVWYAHLVDLSEAEISLLAETGTAMAHCPQANARLGSGLAPADKLHSAGGTVSLGVDGAAANEAADMGAAMYSAFCLHRAVKGVQAVRPETVLHWASEGGARCLGFERTGRLAPGMAADIAVFDLSHPRNMGLQDPALAPVLTGAAVVRDSFVGGRPLVRDGRLPNLDLEDLAAEAREATRRLRTHRNDALLQCAPV